MAYPCTKASFGGSAFAVVDDRTIVSARSTTQSSTARVSDNSGRDTGTQRNRLTAGTLVSKGGRDANAATIGCGY
jgi:hypothetical protein